jgi:undecaprenyl-diphosphatase
MRGWARLLGPWWRWSIFAVVVLPVTLVALRDPVPALEVSISEWFRGLSSPTLDPLMMMADTVGSVGVIGVGVTLVVALLLLRGSLRTALALLAAGISGYLVNLALKWAVDRPRPNGPQAWGGYPSGHMLLTTVLVVSMVLLVRASRWRRLAVGAAAVVLAVMGFSRLYLGEHYPIDVVGGLGIGLSIVWAADLAIGFDRASATDAVSPRPEDARSPRRVGTP